MKVLLVCCVCLCVLSRVSEAFISRLTDTVNRSVAFERCGNRLAPFSNISRLAEQANGLEDGQSAWVSGSVKYSPYLTWLGCYESRDNLAVQPTSLRNKGAFLYSCSSECYRQTKAHLYIAIYGGSCFCLRNSDKDGLKTRTDCEIDVYQMTQPGYRHNGDKYILYSMDHYGIQQRMDKQCVSIKYQSDQSTFQSKSCYQNSSADGFICTFPISTPSCSSFACAHNSSMTREEAFSVCANDSGALTDYFELDAMQAVKDVQVGKEYWTGLFRAFTVVTNGHDNEDGEHSDFDTCLAVTKVNGQVFLDPDVCTADKFYICDHYDVTMVISTRISSPIVLRVSTPTPKTDKDDPVLLYLLIGAAGLVMTILILVGTVFCVRRRRVKSRNQLSYNEHSPQKYQRENPSTSDAETHAYDYIDHHGVGNLTPTLSNGREQRLARLQDHSRNSEIDRTYDTIEDDDV